MRNKATFFKQLGINLVISTLTVYLTILFLNEEAAFTPWLGMILGVVSVIIASILKATERKKQ